MATYASQLIGKVGLEGSEKTKADLKQIGEQTDKAESSFKKLKERLAHGLEIGAGIQLAQIPGNIFEGLKDQFIDVVKAGADQQAVIADTANTLEHMGKASGQTTQSIGDFADKMSRLTTFSDDLIQHGENVMLTFGNIGKNIFPQATMAAMDMSAKLHTDLQTSIIEVGKALNDPIQGVGALQRVGVSFTEQEKAQIKTMMQHNDVAGAQKIVMYELNKQFAGTAETAGKGFAGQLAIAGNRIDQLKEKIGTALLPILTEFLGYFEQHILPRLDDFSNWFQRDGIPKIQEFGNWFQTQGIPALQNFGGEVGTVIGDLIGFVQWLQKGGPAADAVKVALAGVGTIIAGFKLAGFLNELNTGIGNIITSAGNMKQSFSNFINWFGNTFLSNFKNSASQAANALDGNNGISAAANSTENTVKRDAALMDAELAGENGIAGSAKVASGAIRGIGVSLGEIMGSLGILIAAEQGGIMLANALGVKSTPNPGNVQSGVQSIQNINQGPLGGFIQWLTNFFNGVGGSPKYPGVHGRASGGINIPAGDYLIGERGPEIMQVPGGSNIIPNNMLGAYSTGSGNGSQILILSIDGVQFARVAMPYLTNQIRYSVGSVGF